MNRPRAVADAIDIVDGLHVGRYGDMRLHSAYQPIFCRSGEVLVLTAFEGLVRTERGGRTVPPAEFFAATEPHDALFVECMCRALHLRNYAHARPERLALFLNVNPALYRSSAVIEREFGFMFSNLAQYGLNPDRLVCELIEKEALSDAVLAALCATFRSYGARLAIDDFGTGSSGIERYRALRPDIIKIDGPMFRRMAATPNGRRMLRAMTRTLLSDGTTILVEGIETPAQLQVAEAVGATLFQGYGLGRPERLPYTFAADTVIGLAHSAPDHAR